MENSPPEIQTIPVGAVLGGGFVLGVVGPKVARDAASVVDGELTLALSDAWRERDIRATIPPRTNAAITARTSHFLGCAGGAGSATVGCDLFSRLGLVGMVGTLEMIVTVAPRRCHC